MENDNFEKKAETIYSKRLRAGKRRTYFFDVRSTKGNDYYLTITESRKRFDDNGYDRHKVFLYKEDFNKFVKALNEAVNYVKTELMPDFDFDAFNHDDYIDGEEGGSGSHGVAPAAPVHVPEVTRQPEDIAVAEVVTPAATELPESPAVNTAHEDVEKW